MLIINNIRKPKNRVRPVNQGQKPLVEPTAVALVKRLSRGAIENKLLTPPISFETKGTPARTSATKGNLMKHTVAALATRIGTFAAGMVGAVQPEHLTQIETAFTMLALVAFDLITRKLKEVV